MFPVAPAFPPPLSLWPAPLKALCRAVCRAHGVRLAALLTTQRGCRLEAEARQCAIYLAHTLLRLPVARLARLFGRDRATIRHALHRTEDRRDDPAFDAVLQRLEARFTPKPSGADPMARPRASHATRMTLTNAEGGAVTVNLAESPLLWLATRKDAQGRAYLDASEVQAGERFRQDVTLAGLVPSLGAQWTTPLDRSARGPGGLSYTDTLIAARERLTHARRAVGPEFFSLLTDVCGFLTPLPQAEAARGWPVRSGKLVLKLGLAALARHYGLSAEAQGPERSRGIRAWTAERDEAL